MLFVQYMFLSRRSPCTVFWLIPIMSVFSVWGDGYDCQHLG